MAVITARLIPPLLELMKHSEPQVRRAAYRAFATFSLGAEGRAAEPLLRSALRDQDLAIRSSWTNRENVGDGDGESGQHSNPTAYPLLSFAICHPRMRFSFLSILSGRGSFPPGLRLESDRNRLRPCRLPFFA
jgi:hypothetical protein